MKNFLTEKELATLIHLAQKALWSDINTRRKIQDHRINIIPANFYSDVPLIDDVINSFEYRTDGDEIYNSGIFDPKKMKNVIDSLSPYSKEFSPPIEGDIQSPNGFFWKNPAFSYSDAMAYYCILRYYKPNPGNRFRIFYACS